MSRMSCVSAGLLALLLCGCDGGAAPTTELTPDLVEAAKVHDAEVADAEKAHQAADKAAAKAEAGKK